MRKNVLKNTSDDTADTDTYIYINWRDSICIYSNLHGFWSVFHKCWKGMGMGEKGRRRDTEGGLGIHVRDTVRLTINADLSHSAFRACYARKIVQRFPFLPLLPLSLFLFISLFLLSP